MDLSARLLHRLNGRFPKRPTLPRDDILRYWETQFLAAEGILSFYLGYVDFMDKTVLDLGCGWGAVTSYVSLHSRCRKITGADSDGERILLAREFSSRKACRTSDFATLESSSLPFEDGTFDVVISQNTFEHVENPLGTLNECRRVMKPGGFLCTVFNPLYYSRYGSHLYDYVFVPWVHLLFPRRTLVDFVGRQGDVGPVAPAGYAVSQFLTLNRITFSRFKTLAGRAGFRPVFLQCESDSSAASLPLIGNLFRSGLRGIFAHAR